MTLLLMNGGVIERSGIADLGEPFKGEGVVCLARHKITRRQTSTS